jgi:hypothetical protein
MNKVNKIDTGIVELLLVKIPEDLQFYLNQFGVCGISQTEGQGAARYIPNINIDNVQDYSIVGKFCDLTNEQLAAFVPKVKELGKDEDSGFNGAIWKNYCDEDILITANQSFYSCILSHGLLTREPKKPVFSLKELTNITLDTDTPMQQYKKNIERYINPKTTLVLIKNKK